MSKGETFEFQFPKYQHIFSNTYGLFAYQEQLMALAGEMSGFDSIKQDVLRKATGRTIDFYFSLYFKIFIPKLRDYLFEKEIFDIKYSIIDRGNFCTFHFGSKKGNLSLYNYMYYDGCFCLERKKVKFEFCPF